MNRSGKTEIALFNVRASLDKKRYPSVFGNVTKSKVSSISQRSSGSKASHASSSKIEAAAELAAKKAQLQSVHEIQAQRDKLAQIQAEFQRMIKDEEDKLRFGVYKDEQNTSSDEGRETPAIAQKP